jgi:hypothetical protein
MDKVLTENAQIEYTSLGPEDHGIFTAYIGLKFKGSGQAFGGYSFDEWDKAANKRIGCAYGMRFIQELMETLGVRKWEDLKGTYVRVKHDWGKVHAIGHLIEERWFDPSELADRMGIK